MLYAHINVSHCSVIKLHNRTHVVHDQTKTKSTKPAASRRHKRDERKKKQQQRRSGRRCTETRVEHNLKIYVLAHSSIIIYPPQRHRASHQTYFFHIRYVGVKWICRNLNAHWILYVSFTISIDAMLMTMCLGVCAQQTNFHRESITRNRWALMHHVRNIPWARRIASHEIIIRIFLISNFWWHCRPHRLNFTIGRESLDFSALVEYCEKIVVDQMPDRNHQ